MLRVRRGRHPTAHPCRGDDVQYSMGSMSPMGNYSALTDHLGSAQVTAAEGGAASGVQRYTAFGEVRSRGGEMPTAYQYTGQLSQMEQVGLYHYRARWFDPAGAHFTQADTLIPDLYNPLDWDRYAYGRGNPLKYTDPTGHMQVCADGDEGGGCGSSSPKSLLALNNIDVQEAIRDYVRARPHYNPEFDPGVFNDRIIYSAVATAMMQVLQEGNGSPQHWHKLLSSASINLQDLALGTSAVGSTMEVLGLAAGGPEGVAIGNGFHQIFTSPIETVASWSSTFATIADDFVIGQSDFATGKIGESTATSLITSTIGTFIPIATIDVAIDGYAAAYNHGNAPGVFTIYAVIREFMLSSVKVIR